MRALVVVSAAAFALLCFGAVAQAAPPSITDSHLDGPAVVTVGDRLTYTITLEADPGTKIALAPAGLPAEVSLIDTPQTTIQLLGNGRVRLVMTFQVAPFVTGKIDLPTLPLRYSAPDGTSGILDAPAEVINVQSVLPQDTTNIVPRDLKPQAEIGTAPVTWIWPVVGGLIAAVFLLSLLALWRRAVLRRRAAYVPPRVPVVAGPEDMARVDLDKAGADFGSDSDLVAYYSTIGVTVRRYLTDRYGFPAFALTTRELEAEMLRRGLDRWQVRVAAGLLEQCDAVVYAGYRPAAERADADLTAAYEIVEMSRPEETIPEVSKQEAGVS